MTLLEQAIISEIAKTNDREFPFINDHIPYLKVKSRRYTGVGVYVNFEYQLKGMTLNQNFQNDLLLSGNKELHLDILKYRLVYVLSISNGRIETLELVTDGDESWDGNYNSFKFIDP